MGEFPYNLAVGKGSETMAKIPGTRLLNLIKLGENICQIITK